MTGVAEPQPASASASRAGGRPYIDVHAHIGETINRVPPVGQTIERYLGRMAESGVVAALPCPAAGGPLARGVADTRDQNQAIAGACRSHPDRFPLGFAIVEVRQQQAGVDEIERAMCDDGLAGFMCHAPISGHQMGEELYPALELVDGRGGVVLLHVGGRGTEARAAAHASRFRNTTFIMAHVSMARDQHQEAVKHLAGLENAWYDFAQHPADADDSWALAEIVNRFGAERLLFGSDSPYYDHRLLRAQIEAAALPDTVKDRIAWRNAVELVQRFRPAWRLNTAPVARPAALAGADLWAQQPDRPGRLL
jgi:predicted TIM-barrel fold metal-dependent hydrolase